MDADVVGHHELHPGEADAVGRDAPPAERRARVAEVEHDLGVGVGNVGEVEFLDLELGGALVDEALVALGARHRDFLVRVEKVGGVAGADDGGQAEFAADDGGVRGAAAVVGDDRGRALHDRHPVGVGGLGDENRAVDELVDVLGALDDAHAAGDDGLADRQAGDQFSALFGDVVPLERARCTARLHGFGPSLDDEHVAGLAVLRPFHVHRAAVVLLDGAGPAGEGEDLGVGEDVGGAFGLGGRHVEGRAVLARPVDHLDRLLAALLLDDRRQRGVGEQRLEHLVFVGIDGALHDVLAEAEGGVDEDDLVEAGLGVEGEHDAGAAEVGAHHVLDADRQGDLHVVEALDRAVGDGAVGEQRGEAAAAGVEKRRRRRGC